MHLACKIFEKKLFDTTGHTFFSIFLKPRPNIRVKMTKKQYVTLRDPKMYTHKNVGSLPVMKWNTVMLQARPYQNWSQRPRSQWPRDYLTQSGSKIIPISNVGVLCHMSQCMRFPTMWYVRPAKPQISLRIRIAWSEPCSSLEYSMSVKLLIEHLLEVLSSKVGCTGSSESTFVKMSNCWKSHVTAHIGDKFHQGQGHSGSKLVRCNLQHQDA